MREIRMGEVHEPWDLEVHGLALEHEARPSATPTRSTMVRVTWSQFEANPNPMLAGYGLGAMVPRERQFTTSEAAEAFCEGLRCSPGINNVRINGTP